MGPPKVSKRTRFFGSSYRAANLADTLSLNGANPKVTPVVLEPKPIYKVEWVPVRESRQAKAYLARRRKKKMTARRR
jgi:hypothetical protein